MRSDVLLLFLICVGCLDSGNPSAQQHAASTVCGGQLYDSCASDDQCESGMCKLYSNRMVQACTQACDAANPCPPQNGVAVTCNNMGLCRPDKAITCDAP